MIINKQFIFVLLIVFILCIILYFIRNNTFREGLKLDTNDSAVNEAQAFAKDNNLAGNNGFIKILPLESTSNPAPSKSGIMADYPNILALPVNQFTVKSSYNSCCSGDKNHFISAEMLMYVLSRGCRFIDLEISNVVTDATNKTGTPYVVYPDHNSPNPIDVKKCVKLDTILKTLVTYGLTEAPSSSAGATPNYSDPLFLHLRINPDPVYKNLYQDVAACIKKNLADYLFGHTNITPVPMSIKDFVTKSILPVLTNKDLMKKFDSLNVTTTNSMQKFISINTNGQKIFSDLQKYVVSKDISTMDIYDFAVKPPVQGVLMLPFVNDYFNSLSDILTLINATNPLYSSAQSIQNLISYIYFDNQKFDITKTKIQDIMGKIIVILDSNYDQDWKKGAKCPVNSSTKCYDLNDFVHVESGDIGLTLNTPFTLSTQPTTPVETNADGISVVMKNNGIPAKQGYGQIVLPESELGILNTDPDNKYTNPLFQDLVTKWGSNFIANRFYIRDPQLTQYEKFFNSQSMAIVPLAYTNKYFLQRQIQNAQ